MMSLRLLIDQIRLKSRQAVNIVVITSSKNNNHSNNINRTSLFNHNSSHITGIQTLVNKQFCTICVGRPQKISQKNFNPIRSSLEVMTLTGSIKATTMDHLSHHQSSCRSHSTIVHSEKPFLPRRALILRKFSRLEYERLTHPEFDEEQLKLNLNERGSDYESLKHYDQVHKTCLHQIESALSDDMIEFQTVDRYGYTEDKIAWADVIITSGGDGTFLMAASRIITRDKPVIGVNSDPTKSVGHLCLPKEYSNNFKKVIQLLKDGRYQWIYRQRLRITLIGEAADEDPRELNDIRNNHKNTDQYLDQDDSNDQPSSPASSRSPLSMQQRSCYTEQQRQLSTPNGYIVDSIATNSQDNQQSAKSYQTVDGKIFSKIQQIKEKALNEVFVGETLSARVSYFELSINNNRSVKVKSSGMAVCTGTGSTSWNLNMNKLTAHQVQSILKIISSQHGRDLTNIDALKIAKEFNELLTFPATKPIMAYSVRDPVDNATGPPLEPRGYPKMIEVKSRMQDGCLVLDSRQTYPFNDGSYALIEMYDEDALKTISV